VAGAVLSVREVMILLRCDSRFASIAAGVAVCLLPSTLAAQDPAPNGAQNVDPRLTYDVHIVMIHLPDLTVAMDCVAKWWRKGRKLRVEFAGGPMSLVALRDGNADCVLLPSQRKAIRFVGREAPVEVRCTQADLVDVL